MMNEDVPGQEVDEGTTRATSVSHSKQTVAIAIAIFALAGIVTFRDVLQSGPTSSAMVSSIPLFHPIAEGDVVFEAWLTARNARTLLTEPHRLFDTPHCAPAEKTLTLGVPMITMGLLATPVALFTRNPALAYNFSIFCLLVVTALAMFLLIREWTGNAAAGIIAGLLFAFGPIRVGWNITHPSVWDSAWLVFALFFARRLFEHGRWLDAFALAAACSLQIAASFYPLVGAVLFVPFFVAWLFTCYGLEKVQLAQLGFVLLSAVATAALLLGPYLLARDTGAIGGRTEFGFALWSNFMPGKQLFLGWGAVLLGMVGCLIPRRSIVERLGGDPRWVLIIGGLITTAVAAGPNNNELLELAWPGAPFEIPDLYRALLRVIPGLDSIRVVHRLVIALQITSCILAGFGAAWLIRRSEARSLLVGMVIIVAVFASIIPEPKPRTTVVVHADADAIQFFEDLEKVANAGPLLELPLLEGSARSTEASPKILLAAYHERRTSTCFGSYRAPERETFIELVQQLPEPHVYPALRDLGFTTVVLDKRKEEYAGHFVRRISQLGKRGLRLVHDGKHLVAFEL